MDLLEKFAQKKKKKKNSGINQCGEKGGEGGFYIPAGSVDYSPGSYQFEMDIYIYFQNTFENHIDI
jgi:hypothetical protein